MITTPAVTGEAVTATVPTPIGPFTVIALTGSDRPTTVLAAGWTDDPEELRRLIAADLRPEKLVSQSRLENVTDAVIAYHKGDLTAIDTIAVQQHSGAFVSHAWDVLRSIPAGSPVSYTEYAARSGRPGAVRAAGYACAHNAAALFVPCHRVLRTDGSLGGFRWGLPVKQWLLDHEAA